MSRTRAGGALSRTSSRALVRVFRKESGGSAQLASAYPYEQAATVVKGNNIAYESRASTCNRTSPCQPSSSISSWQTSVSPLSRLLQSRKGPSVAQAFTGLGPPLLFEAPYGCQSSLMLGGDSRRKMHTGTHMGRFLPDSVFSKGWLRPQFRKKLEELLHDWGVRDGLESLELFARTLMHENTYYASLIEEMPGKWGDLSLDETAKKSMTAHQIVRGRLELLGDSVLSISVLTELANRDNNLDGGQITALKSEMVSNRCLASFAEAKHPNIPELIVAHPWIPFPADSRGVALRNETANAVERLVGAVYVEKGLEAALAVTNAKILPWMVEYIEKSYGKGPAKNPVSVLTELFVKEYKTNPEFTYAQDELPPKHSVAVSLHGTVLATGHGESRQEAKRRAAEIVLSHAMWKDETPGKK